MAILGQGEGKGQGFQLELNYTRRPTRKNNTLLLQGSMLLAAVDAKVSTKITLGDYSQLNISAMAHWQL